MTVLAQDLRYGLRILVRDPWFAAMAIFTIALGIGAATAIFSAMNAVLLRALPYEEPDRLVMVWATTQGSGSVIPVSPANMTDWRNQNQVFEDIGGYAPQSYNLTGSGDPERIQGAVLTSGLVSLLRVKPIHGRIFSEDEDKPGAQPVVLISETLWQRRFNSDPGLVGRSITLSGNDYTVVGIWPTSLDLLRIAAPAGSALDTTELWTLLGPDAKTSSSRGTNVMRVIARLKPGVTVQRAQAEMSVTADQLGTQYPETNTGQGIRLVPLYDEIVGGTGTALWILFVAVAFVLLIGCANVANLLLIRGFRRQKEIALRAALGASSGRLIRQLLTESLLLSLLGGALGLFLALLGASSIAAVSPRNIIRLDQISLEGRAIAFTLGASLLTGVIFGLVPAFQISKVSMNESLKEGGRGNSDTRQRIRSLLVSFEVALALVLLIGAGLVIKSITGLLSGDPGFKTENLVTMRVLLSPAKYPEAQQWIKFFQDATQRIQNLPGVQSVGLINNLPLSGTGANSGFTIEGRPPATQEGYLTGYRVVSSNYFNTMGITIKSGAEFTARDNQNSPAVAVVNEAMVRRFWPSEDPIGKRLAIGREQTPGKDTVWREVVGIAANVKHWGLMQEAPPETYVPDLQSPSLSMFLVVSSPSNPTSLVSAIRREILAIDNDQPVYSVKTIEDLVARSISQSRFYMILLSIFAGIALLMAVVGIYGLLAYSINQRKHEIGIRMALGAQPGDIIKMILAQGMKLALIGIAAGLVVAFALTRLMSSLLYGVSATDPFTFVGVSLFLALVALIATYLPARSATSVDPAIALRVE